MVEPDVLQDLLQQTVRHGVEVGEGVVLQAAGVRQVSYAARGGTLFGS